LIRIIVLLRMKLAPVGIDKYAEQQNAANDPADH